MGLSRLWCPTGWSRCLYLCLCHFWVLSMSPAYRVLHYLSPSGCSSLRVLISNRPKGHVLRSAPGIPRIIQFQLLFAIFLGGGAVQALKCWTYRATLSWWNGVAISFAHGFDREISSAVSGCVKPDRWIRRQPIHSDECSVTLPDSEQVQEARPEQIASPAGSKWAADAVARSEGKSANLQKEGHVPSRPNQSLLMVLNRKIRHTLIRLEWNKQDGLNKARFKRMMQWRRSHRRRNESKVAHKCEDVAY